MPPNRPDWLDIVTHRIRGYWVPYLVIVQHHGMPATSRLAAPVSRSLAGDVDILAPPIMIGDAVFRVRILDITAIPLNRLGETVTSASSERDAIMNAIDIVLHGYPAGMPRDGYR